MNRTLLEEPFSAHQIRQREGPFGILLDYIEGHAVIQRLNDAFEGGWSFEIVRHEIHEDLDEVIVLGCLSADGIIKTQFGSASISRARESGSPICLGDDLKSAATDALKKCATLLGVGLHLYRRDPNANDPKPDKHQRALPQPREENSAPSGKRPEKDSPGVPPQRISSRQQRYLQTLIREHDLSPEAIDALCIKRFGTIMDELSRPDASALIAQLKANKTLAAVS